MLTLRAAFRKRLLKHKDKQGSTAHHGAGAEEHPKAYEQGRRGGRGDKLLGHRSEYAWHGEALDRPGSYTHEYSQGYKEGHGAAGKHKNVQAAVMKAVRAVAKHRDVRGSTTHHKTPKRQRVEPPYPGYSAESVRRDRAIAPLLDADDRRMRERAKRLQRNEEDI